MYGNVLAEVELESSIKIISIRASAFAVATEEGSAAKVEELAFRKSAIVYGEVVGFDSSATGRPELSDAKIVVSGGRGVQSKEGFDRYINPLADSLGLLLVPPEQLLMQVLLLMIGSRRPVRLWLLSFI